MRTGFVEWLAVLLGLFNEVLTARGKRIAFLVGIAANALWLIFACIYGHWGLFVESLICIAASAYGYWKWKGDAAVNN